MKTDQLIIDGKVYLSTRRAAEIAGYSADYVGQLCRAGKIERRMINRTWYVEKDSIVRHSEETFKANHTSFKSDDFKYTYEKAISSPFPLLLTPSRNSMSPRSVISLSQSVTNQYTDQTHTRTMKVLGTSLVLTGLISALIFVVGLNVVNLTKQNSNNFVASVQTPLSDDSQSSLAHAGVVVVPSSGSNATDTKLASTITNSFSDPVTVKQAGNTNAGIITPVFRTVKGHDYMYVLVPVNTSSSSATSTRSDTSKN